MSQLQAASVGQSEESKETFLMLLETVTATLSVHLTALIFEWPLRNSFMGAS